MGGKCLCAWKKKLSWALLSQGTGKGGGFDLVDLESVVGEGGGGGVKEKKKKKVVSGCRRSTARDPTRSKLQSPQTALYYLSWWGYQWVAWGKRKGKKEKRGGGGKMYKEDRNLL